MDEFDDSRLENHEILRGADPLLIPLAESGARLRREASRAELPLAGLSDLDRPRAVIAFGPEARLLRAVLEPVCPVPFMAWPALGLPGWVGPLDVVVVMGGRGPESLAVAHEAVRRGARLLVACPPDSHLAVQSASRATTLLPISTSDPLVSAILVLVALHRLGLGPAVNTELIADAMDVVAGECGWRHDVSANPAKAIALDLAEAQPLVWGGSIMAARASRRLAEALRAASGRVCLAADARALLPLLEGAAPLDPFADPFEEAPMDRRPGLVMIDDGLLDEAAERDQNRLANAALRQDIRISLLSHTQGGAMERYVTVLLKGLYAAAYLQVGLGRTLS